MLLRVGSCRIDVERRQLVREGRDRHLPPKAFDLLLGLVATRPNVVRKEELMNRVWPGAFVSEANLAVLIGDIRAAMGDSARSPRFIKTHHGVGYSFIGDVTELARPPAAPLPGPVFVLHTGQRRIVLPQGTTTVGRDDICDIVLNDPSVSRRHARLHVDGNTVFVEDAGSKNRTRVDQVRIAGPTPVHDGQRIVFGNVETTIALERSSDASTVTIDERESS